MLYQDIVNEMVKNDNLYAPDMEITPEDFKSENLGIPTHVFFTEETDCGTFKLALSDINEMGYLPEDEAHVFITSSGEYVAMGSIYFINLS